MKLIHCVPLIFFVFLFVSCEEEASEPYRPVITLIGNRIDTASLNVWYKDPGAFARAELKGLMRNREAESSGEVNTALPGTYYIEYNYTDDAGNRAATVTRTVHVTENASAFLNGPYHVAFTCTASSRSSSTPTLSRGTYTALISSAARNYRFEISALNAGPAYPTVLDAALRGNDIFLGIYDRDLPVERTSASGTLSPSKNSFTIDCSSQSFENGLTYKCRNVFTRDLVEIAK